MKLCNYIIRTIFRFIRPSAETDVRIEDREMTVAKWIKKQNPKTMPFRPNAPYTGDSFDLRTSKIGSPMHLGQDRGGNPNHIVAPFDGRLVWEKLNPESAWGAIARLVPNDNPEVEIQIGHCSHVNVDTDSIDVPITRGQTLPIVADDIGLSKGAHTHTEWIIKNSQKNYSWFVSHGGKQRIKEREIDLTWLRKHCDKHNLDFEDTLSRLQDQLKTWGIQEVYDHFAIRRSPVFNSGYRQPHWGEGEVIIADTRKFLNI